MIPQHRDFVTEPPEGDVGIVLFSGAWVDGRRKSDRSVWADLQDERGTWKRVDAITAATFDDDLDEPFVRWQA